MRKFRAELKGVLWGVQAGCTRAHPCTDCERVLAHMSADRGMVRTNRPFALAFCCCLVRCFCGSGSAFMKSRWQNLPRNKRKASAKLFLLATDLCPPVPQVYGKMNAENGNIFDSHSRSLNRTSTKVRPTTNHQIGSQIRL